MRLSWLCAPVLLASTWARVRADEPPPRPIKPLVRFNRDVRPILSENCFQCHGPDTAKRKAGLRLDTAEGAFADLKGAPALVKGQSAASELFKRVTSKDPDEQMPPPKAGKTLTPDQIDVLKRWIDSGAGYEPHWSYIKVARPPVPLSAGVPRLPVDAYLEARLRDEKLAPAGEADRATLARRLFFDLVGLPPKPEEVDAFVADRSPDAYGKLVDRLLASPHFGERMAIYWLDVVRYADSIGYHSDIPREVAPYRDYVIRAFNDNKRFDQFTIEQLGGDLLPRATTEQRVASTYNMLLLTTEEGGAQPKEYEAKNAGDRVRAVSGVWLGSTMGCSQCHDHKYDPFSIRDFYTMAAFFADLYEFPVDTRQELLLVTTPAQESASKRIDTRLEAAEWQLSRPSPRLGALEQTWQEAVLEAIGNATERWHGVKTVDITARNGTTPTVQNGGTRISADGATPDQETFVATVETDQANITALRLEVFGGGSFFNRAYARAGDGNAIVTGVQVAAVGPGGEQTVALGQALADYEQEGFGAAGVLDRDPETGWGLDGQFTPLGSRGAPTRKLVLTFARPLPGGPGTRLRVTIEHGSSRFPKRVPGAFALAVTALPKPEMVGLLTDGLVQALRVAPVDRTAAQKTSIRDAFRAAAPSLAGLRREIHRLTNDRMVLLHGTPKTLHSVRAEPRTVRVLARGNWMDDSGDVVLPGVPHFLPQIATEGRATRLDLGRWLVSPENPLTSRVLMNRLWKLFFGYGLSRTLDDLGAQGEWPSHPQLLDWLAAELMDSGWNVKHMVKLLVTSEAYRRRSTPPPGLKARDPLNRLFGRQTPFRLDAEMVRDNALAVSGLLSPHLGGASVKPYQPDGYWADLNFPKRTWVIDHGEKGHRRGLYTHWQRTFLQPSLLAFDAPTREECTAERARSNTPQQALALLNDPTYTEAARVFAERLVKEGGRTDEERIAWAFRRTLSRPPSEAETQLLSDLRRKHLERYRSDESAARALLQVGDAPPPKNADVADLASWCSVTRAILNLHETITRS